MHRGAATPARPPGSRGGAQVHRHHDDAVNSVLAVAFCAVSFYHFLRFGKLYAAQRKA